MLGEAVNVHHMLSKSISINYNYRPPVQIESLYYIFPNSFDTVSKVCFSADVIIHFDGHCLRPVAYWIYKFLFKL